jgi:hypothetical protein
MRCRWAGISAWTAAGVAAQISCGRGKAVSPLTWVYSVTALPASPEVQVGLNGYG